MSTIKILHLSDLQFGKSNRFVSKERYSDDVDYKIFAESIVSEVITTWNNAPDIITVTGDIAESAMNTEYKIAEEFFNLMLKKFENTYKLPQLYIVPGNHDINFGETKASRDTNEAESLFKFKFSNYNAFLKSLFRSDRFKVTRKHPYFVDKTCNGQLLLLGLNSAISVTHNQHRGVVTLEQILTAIDETNQLDPAGNVFRIAIVHHNFTRKSDIDDENLSDADKIQDILINGKFQLLLHGHRHLAGAELRRNLVNGKQIFILAIGSAGLDSNHLPDVPNQFQLITIDLDSTVKISVQRRVFSTQTVGSQGRGKWINDVSEAKSGDFHFFIYPEDIRNVIESIQQKVCSISSKTPTIHFSKGFETHELYSTLLDIAQDRLWILGRKNRKLFDKNHWAKLKKILEKRQKGFDLRILFLSPHAPKNILDQAHTDIDFKDQLNLSIESTSKFLAKMGIKFSEVCKFYCKERTISMIVVDNAVLFTRIEPDYSGRAKPLTNSPFNVVSSNSTIGRERVHQFNEIWEISK